MLPRTRILLLTGQGDPMIPFLLSEASEKEKQTLFFFPTDAPKEAKLTMRLDRGRASFSTAMGTLDSQDISSVWFRRFVPPDLQHFERDLKLYCEAEHRAFFDCLEYLIPHAMWVSRPSAVTRARNRALQFSLARKLGFIVASTTVTNDPEVLVSQVIQSGSEIVYKSIFSPRIPVKDVSRVHSVFTTKLSESDLSFADGLQSCPGILQEFVKKEADIRVTVFRDTIFAARIESQLGEYCKVDFRRGSRTVPYIPHVLPRGVAEKCIELVRALSLEFGAIDFALDTDGNYTFFEINPNGQWGWIEEITGQPMRRALIDLLFLRA